jgi:hypothetical protein
MGTIMSGWSTTRTHAQRRGLRLAHAISLWGIALFVGSASAQSGPPPATIEAPNAGDAARNIDDAQAKWTESLGEPSLYVEHARADVGRRHYKSAARNLRKAADMLSGKSKYAYGLDRRRLDQDVAALRLTARDVVAGAIKSPAQLDSILDTTHADLLKRGTAPR